MILYTKILWETANKSFALPQRVGITFEHTRDEQWQQHCPTGVGKGSMTIVRNESRQEVTTVKIWLNERPLSLAAACAPVFGVMVRSVSAVAPAPVAGGMAVQSPMYAEAPLPQVHQVQAPKARLLAPMASGNNGISGFTSKGIKVAKRRTDGASGVPPRGRPV